MATSLVVLVPPLARRLGQPSQPAPSPTAEPSAPPAAVLIPEELDHDLQGVMILVNERSFGTAFQVDSTGSFLTAASLVDGAQRLRLVDNTGGSHAVRIVGLDATAGLAEIQAADAGGTPLTMGDSATVKVGDALEILASAKVVNLRAATPAVVTSADPSAIVIRADDLPGEVGGPLVGPGGTVLGIFTGHGSALPAGASTTDLALWHNQQGTLLPLAGLPPDLVLRGSEDTSAPVAGFSVASISPTRASTALTTQITLNGNGFIAGTALSVRFVPVASPGGGFSGLAPALVSPTVITVKVPAGAAVQDYVVELTNGDGATTDGRTAFTVTP